MSEEKLQSNIVRKFSELFPDKRGQLFHVPNQRNNERQAFKARSIGIFPGVSDLFYIALNIGLEIKEPGSRHKVDHILQQLEWGEILESVGGTWRLVRSVDESISILTGDYSKGLTIADVRKMISLNGGKKTLKF